MVVSEALPRAVARLRQLLPERAPWRASLPLLLGLGALGALPHALQAEANASVGDPAPEAAADPPAAGAADPHPATTSAPPRVDLGGLHFDGDTAYAKTKDGSLAELTLDRALQAGAERLLKRAKPLRGAIVVTDVATGKVLALADLSRGERGTAGRVALGYAAPSASLFKLITTAALLEHTKVSPKQKVCTNGGERRIELRHLEAPKLGPALCAPFGSALGHSRNAVFAQLATRHLMREHLLDIAERFGFDADLPFSQPAVVGHAEIPYNDLEFARTAAGFGETSLTPMGAAHIVSMVAHLGRSSELTLVERWKDYRAPTSAVLGERKLQTSTAKLLSRMMEVTVSGGTSLEAFSKPDGQSYLPRIRVAGKTGTIKPGADTPTTSWFAGFAPARSPKVVVSVLLMNDVVWYNKANEVARDVLRLYFADRRGVTNPFVVVKPGGSEAACDDCGLPPLTGATAVATRRNPGAPRFLEDSSSRPAPAGIKPAGPAPGGPTKAAPAAAPASGHRLSASGGA